MSTALNYETAHRQRPLAVALSLCPNPQLEGPDALRLKCDGARQLHEMVRQGLEARGGDELGRRMGNGHSIIDPLCQAHMDLDRIARKNMLAEVATDELQGVRPIPRVFDC